MLFRSNRGLSAESPNAKRNFRIAVLIPSSNPTYVLAGHSFVYNSSRVTSSPGRSSSNGSTRKGCSCRGTRTPSLRNSGQAKSMSYSPVRIWRFVPTPTDFKNVETISQLQSTFLTYDEALW